MLKNIKVHQIENLCDIIWRKAYIVVGLTKYAPGSISQNIYMKSQKSRYSLRWL